MAGVAAMTGQPAGGASRGWEALRRTAGAELCAEGRLSGMRGRDLRLERWWVRAEREELLRLSAYEDGGRRSSRPLYVSEAELIGLLDSAWASGALPDFFRRQLFELVARRYGEHEHG